MILVLISVIILSASATAFFYFNYGVAGSKVIPIDFEVGDVIGMTTDTDALHMGRIPSGNGAMRQLNITNDYEFKIRLYWKAELNDEAEEWISSRMGETEINPGESRIVWINVNVPAGTEDGIYKGNIKIFFIRA